MNHARNGDQSEALSLNDPGRMKGNLHPHCHHDPTSHHSRQRIWGPEIIGSDWGRREPNPDYVPRCLVVQY